MTHNVMATGGMVNIVARLLEDSYDLPWLEGWHSGHTLTTSTLSMPSSRLSGSGSPCFRREAIYP